MLGHDRVKMRTRVKICGLTRREDVATAVHAGADAIGLVFYPGSKRCVSIEQARELRRSVPAFVSVVALFVNASSDQVHSVIDQVKPDLLQFHGDESPEVCASYDHRYIRAFRVGAPGLQNDQQVLETALSYPDAAGWLFDTYSPGYGGSGMQFDHALLSRVRASTQARPIILAGGLDAGSVGTALCHARPYGVDVSSGVERSPGVKCKIRLAAFMQAVAQADSRQACIA